MIKIARGIIILGGVFIGIGLALSLYTWAGSDFYFFAAAGAFVCGTVAKLAASFVK